MLRTSKTGVGLHLALAIMMPPKGKASSERVPTPEQSDGSDNLASNSAPPHLTGRWDFSRLISVEAAPEVVGDALESAQKAQSIVQDAWRMTVRAAVANAAVADADAKQEADKIIAAAQPEQAISSHGEQATDSSEKKFVPKPMTFQEARLWLQSFNAGPYACLKYEGNVPFQETRNYVPRVLKNYEEITTTEYDTEIEAAATKYGLDPQMIRAIMKTESDFQNDTVSHAGARGLMQVMPVVWSEIKKKYELDWDYSTGVFEPEQNIEVACAYLAWIRYDFLPRHFDAYEADPAAPVVLVRDRDRGVPDRKSPRIIVKAVDGSAGPASVELASVAPDAKAEASKESKVVIADAPSAPRSQSTKRESKASARDEKEDPKASKRAIEISDVDTVKVAKKSSNGKTRVVLRGGSGKAVSLSVGSKGKISATMQGAADKLTPKLAGHSHDDKDHDALSSKRKQKSVAKADKREADTQGG